MTEPSTAATDDHIDEEPLRIGLLKCGRIRAGLVEEHGDYPELFGALMAKQPVEIITFDAESGELPTDPTDCHGWFVSGSANSVYDDLPWIAETAGFLRSVVDAGVPLVGICFGHQLLAQALGGEVRRSERGWGVGVHHYDVVEPLPSWPAELPQPTGFALIASHQDQVTRAPAMATVLASSHHCPVAAFAVGDRVLAVQAHPEFTPELSAGLIRSRTADIGAERSEAALASLDQPVDDELCAAWFAEVLRR